MLSKIKAFFSKSDLAKKAAENIIDQPTQDIGASLSDLWGIVFGDRLSYARQMKNLQYAANLEAFKARLNTVAIEIPPERRLLPDFQTASLALEDAKHCVENETLREMFVKLITASMDSQSEPYTHPSFSGIIKQMSTIDAKLFRSIYQEYENGYMPMISPQLSIVGTNKFVPGAFPFWLSGVSVEGCDIFQLSTSFFNLERLGLLDLIHNNSLSDPSQHNFLYKHPALVAITEELQAKYPKSPLQIHTTNSVGHISDFGLNFARCCL